MPTGRQCSGLGLAIADDRGDEKIGIVERRTVGVREGVAEFAALMDEPGVSGATWEGIPPGKENCRNNRRRPSVSVVMSG